MNKSISESRQYMEYVIQHVRSEDQKHFVFFAPAFHLPVISEILKNHSFHWGGQNCHFEDQGAFTGENSPKILKDLGAGYCLVGHSERRKLFFEEDSFICKKVQALLKNDICPILCVGETEDEKNKGYSFDVVYHQLKNVLEHISKTSVSIGVAYEPVWAIGTGKGAKPDDVAQMQQFIRQQCESFGKKVFVLYGGSVNNDNIKDLFPMAGLSGFLVGGVSLIPDQFLSLFQTIKQQ